MDERQDHDYDDDKDHLARDPPFGRATCRFGSPYPHTIIDSPSQGSVVHHTTPSSTSQAMVERNVNIQAQPHLVTSPNKKSPRPSGPIKHPSIRWDTHLPVPDRKRTASSVGFNAPLTASASDASVQANDQLDEALQPVHISEDNMDSTGSSRQPTAFGRPSAPMTRPYRQNDDNENIADDDLQSERGSSWEVSVNGDGASDDGCEPIRVKTADNNLFLPPSPCIVEWFNSIRNEAILSFSVDISKVPDDSEVNPETGKIKDKEPYPASYVDFEEEQSMSKILRHHRLHKTSNWLIFRELESREREKERRKQRRKNQERSKAKVDNSRQRALVRTTNKQPATVSRDGPLSDCVLRPALLSDAKGCADIYNLAVETQTVPDTNPVSVHKFESLLNDCKMEKLPSVVAAVQRADLTDVRNWPSTDAYRQYMKWRQTQPEGDESFDTKIYGFAFLAPYEKGPAFGNGATTETVKAVIFVHPEHRRNGIGSALLHRLLTQTSFMYHGDIQYQWIDPAAVEDSFYVPYFRPIHRIVLYGMVGGEGTELQWMDRFMKSFQFDKAGHLNQIYKMTKPHGVDWYDQVIWVHWANKINTGQTFYAGDESECSYDYPGKAQSPVLPPQKLLEYPNGPDYESNGAYSY